MEVDKIAVNDNFSSENQKNTPTNSANEQDVRIFKKHVADEHKEDVSTDLSDNSEDSVQDLGSLFRKLKLSDEKEQSQNQQNNSGSQENGIQDGKASQTFPKLGENSTKNLGKLPNKEFIKKDISNQQLYRDLNEKETRDLVLDVNENKYKEIKNLYSSKDFGKVSKDNLNQKSSNEDLISGVNKNKEKNKESKELNKDLVTNDNLSNKTFSEDSKVSVLQLTENLPVVGVGTTAVESSGANVSTTIDSKAGETTGLQASSVSNIQQIKDQIVDRILVSTANLNANQSVKVVFSPTVLAETEVNIQKLGQALQVQFVSSDVKSIVFIQSNQLDLQGYLQSNLKQFEEVQVSLKEMDNDLDQPKDGRSRNRNEYQSLEEDDDEQ